MSSIIHTTERERGRDGGREGGREGGGEGERRRREEQGDGWKRGIFTACAIYNCDKEEEQLTLCPVIRAISFSFLNTPSAVSLAGVNMVR